MFASIRSCQTRIPSRSQASWNDGGAYAAMPGTRSMFMPARTACWTSRSTRSGGRSSATSSNGRHDAPRHEEIGVVQAQTERVEPDLEGPESVGAEVDRRVPRSVSTVSVTS